MTVREALQRASSLLTEYNIMNTDLEAEYLVCHLFYWNRNQLIANLDLQVTDNQWNQLEQWLKRRINNEPLQYILGYQEFYGRRFNINQAVLIPRPETELLVEAVITEANKLWVDQSLTVIDIGSGSGAIAVTLALEKKHWLVHSIDISKEALQIAEHNAKELQAEVIFHHGNILLPIIEKKINADIIISNPPYIPSEDIAMLSNDVKEYEPILALDGGKEGLDFYHKIISQSQFVLKRPGIIVFEIGINQAEAVKNLLFQSGAEKVRVKEDYQNIPRIVIAWF